MYSKIADPPGPHGRKLTNLGAGQSKHLVTFLELIRSAPRKVANGPGRGPRKPQNTHLSMSPKKTILKELSRASTGPESRPVRPSSLPGWSERPEQFQKAVNELLQARLVEGRKDPEGHMAITLNEHRRGDVERMLRPVWARPAVWAAVAALLAVGAGLAVI